LPARPFKTVANPPAISDLLFSPRAAFIWNHTRRSVAWMNPAARAAFARPPEDFSNALPLSLIRRFAQCVKNQTCAVLSVKIRGGPALRCSVESLKLAGEEVGLIVAETEADSLSAPAAHPASSKKQAIAVEPKKRKLRAPSVKALSNEPAPPPVLSAEEMRAFKAVGRKVRRLCEEKRLSSAQFATAPAPARPQARLTDVQAEQTLHTALVAFDLVLLLDGGLEILRVEGRPRMGWSKAGLMGKPVVDLLPPAGQAQVRRMVGKLKRGASTARDSLQVFDAHGSATPCRVVFGHHKAGGAMFFLGVVSLDHPDGLKKREAQGPHRAPAKLAA
jgi:hypothetical protein